MTNVSDMLLVFGGSGPSSQFYNDLQMFDPRKSEWISVREMSRKTQLQRAGHTSTLVDGKLYIYGGSCAKEYLEEIAVLDVCPAPEIIIDKHKAARELIAGLSDYINCKDFSDITFQVDNKPYYAHKIVLSSMSEHFRAMFKSGMKESREALIEVPNVSYKTFDTLMQYFYTGTLKLDAGGNQEEKLKFLKEMLKASDQFMIDDVKLQCEEKLTIMMNKENFKEIAEAAETFNAHELKAYSQWFYKINFFTNEITKEIK